MTSESKHSQDSQVYLRIDLHRFQGRLSGVLLQLAKLDGEAEAALNALLDDTLIVFDLNQEKRR